MDPSIFIPLLCLLTPTLAAFPAPVPPLAVCYGKSVYVFQKDLQEGTLNTWNTLNAISALAHDQHNGDLVLSDYGRDGKTAMHVVGKQDLVDLALNETSLKLPTGMVLDAEKSALLVTDSKRNAVVRLAMKGATLAEEEDIQYINGEKVRGLAHDKCSRRIFWVLESADGSSIVSADDSLASSSAKFVVSGLMRPKSLSVGNGKLYWMDSVTRSGKKITLESSDLDGSNKKMVCTLNGHDPYDMAVHGGSVYWTDGKNMALWTMDMYKQVSVCQPVLVKKFQSRPLALKFLNQEHDDCNKQEGESSAAKSSCHDYCLGGGVCVVDEEGIPMCQCPTGLKGPRCEEIKLATLHLPEQEVSPRRVSEHWPTILAISFTVCILMVVAVGCGKWLLCGKPARSQRNFHSGDAFSGPIVVSGKKSRPRTFSGRDNCAVVSAPECDRVVVDLEDCCKMTICDRPCVEWSTQQSPRKNLLNRSKAALCSPHKNPIQQDDGQNLLSNEEEEGLSYPD